MYIHTISACKYRSTHFWCHVYHMKVLYLDLTLLERQTCMQGLRVQLMLLIPLVWDREDCTSNQNLSIYLLFKLNTTDFQSSRRIAKCMPLQLKQHSTNEIMLPGWQAAGQRSTWIIQFGSKVVVNARAINALHIFLVKILTFTCFLTEYMVLYI